MILGWKKPGLLRGSNKTQRAADFSPRGTAQAEARGPSGGVFFGALNSRLTQPCHGAALLALLSAAIMVSSIPRAEAEPLSPEQQIEILRQALDDYDDAVTIVREDPTHAVELYRRAAGGFHTLADAGLRNAALEYNLGNVHFRLGELGRAVLHYRRAQHFDPSSERLDANLRYARERVEPVIPPSGQSRLTRRLLFWHYDTSLPRRGQALLLLSALGWVLLFVWLRWRRRPLLVCGLIGVALALASGASVLWQTSDEARYPHAVIVDDKHYLRLGRGEGSDLALKQPLGPGVELRILQKRGGWIEIRLSNDQTGWLPSAASEQI